MKLNKICTTYNKRYGRLPLTGRTNLQLWRQSNRDNKKSRVGKGEFHPQTSFRTVRDPLESYGSSNSRNQLRLTGYEIKLIPFQVGSDCLESADPFAKIDFHQSSLGYSRYYGSVRP